MYVDFDTEYMDIEELQSKFANGEIKPYEDCGDEIPLIIDGYIIGSDV